ncbi:MAG TPA: FAD-dependent oxidoreductase [Myxococcales bacterium]|nr:FAD-dependent oxidoreductase [Myxococcales bacterium]
MAGEQAVVVGGSIAGLLAARVLADHYLQVTVLEADRLEPGPVLRKGVPQAQHLHGLIHRGAVIVERLFPGLFQEIQAEGGLTAEVGPDFLYYQFGISKPRQPTGLVGQLHSRPLLEWSLRRRLASIPNVRTLPGCQATSLSATEDRTRVTGVHFRQDGGGEAHQPADLVVDASGRGSRAPQWLEALGYPRVEESEVRIDVGYSTRLFRFAPRPRDWKFMVILPTPPGQKRLGALAAIEGGRWVATLAGWLKDYPPADEAGFLEYARSLPRPELYENLRDAEPLGPILTYRFPSNLRRRYERMPRFPGGLAVVGDAHCSFNPIYGQGMTTAAIQVEALEQCLRKPGSPAELSRRIRRRAAASIDGSWGAATSGDFNYPEVPGRRPPGFALANWYGTKVAQLTGWDPDAFLRFAHVMQMSRSPAILFTPSMLARVLKLALRGPPPGVGSPTGAATLVQ